MYSLYLMKPSYKKAKLLYKFLKKNCCLQKYLKNVEQQGSPAYEKYKKHKDIIQLLIDGHCCLGALIVWVSTEEGDEFWSNMESKFFAKIFEYGLK